MVKRAIPVLLIALCGGIFAGQLPRGSYTSWDLKESVSLLNDSPWAHTTTFTRLIGGVGSGMAGEKEIYSTFFTRLLSARPIREALARVHQIRASYDKLPEAERKKLDSNLQSGLDADMSNWLVLTVTFRSNNIQLEKEVRRFFDKESAESLLDAAFLSTREFSQIRLAAYYPPQGDGVGAKFVFPRLIDGRPIVTRESPQILFELNVPGADPRLAVTFSVPEMLQNGELVL